MFLLQQIIELLSEPPGNFVYHVITLLALQATVAQALAQARRDAEDRFAHRLAWGGVALLVLRLGFLLVLAGLLSPTDPAGAAIVIPPLERAIDAATILFLIWIIAPHPRRLPRLGHVLLLLGLIVTGALYIFYAQDWANRVATGIPYQTTFQATVWGVAQLGLLAVGALTILISRRRDWLLRLVILLTLLAAHAASLAPLAVAGAGSEIPYWIRLGYLISFPLLAALAYRHTLAQLLASQLVNRPAAEQLARSLQYATRVIDSLETSRSLNQALAMVTDVLPASYVALATFSSNDPDYLRLTSLQGRDDGIPRPQNWGLSLADWPAFRMAINHRSHVELLPSHVGARQLHDLYQELGVNIAGPMLIEPLLVGKRVLGFLLLGKAEAHQQWDERDKALTPSLAAYVARALHNAQNYEKALASSQSGTAAPVRTEELDALEAARDQALAELAAERAQIQKLETELAALQSPSETVAPISVNADQASRNRTIEALESEINALRESLHQAEEAMALAAASESGLSTEWVTQTITRYSGEVEEAESRIAELEKQLREQDRMQTNEIVAALLQELRTPMTSIAGYTEMLLGERAGMLGVKQRHFLQRVQANVERLRALLEQIVHLTSGGDPGLLDAPELVDIRDVIEAAISDIISLVREKELHLDIQVEPYLPPVAANRPALYQIVRNLLLNACQSSRSQGSMTIIARADRVKQNGHGETLSFLQLSVSDSGGGIDPEDRLRVFEFHHEPDSPLIAGIGETGIGLSVTRALVNAHGGRIWVDSEMGSGSTFSVLLPLAGNGQYVADSAASEK